jgi:hypothetical protein
MPQARVQKTARSASEESYLVGYHQRPHHHLLSLCPWIWQGQALEKKNLLKFQEA